MLISAPQMVSGSKLVSNIGVLETHVAGTSEVSHSVQGDEHSERNESVSMCAGACLCLHPSEVMVGWAIK